MDADKSALDNTLSPQQGPDGKAVDCSCVPKPKANHNSGALTCAGCNKTIQVACLVHQFKHAGAPKKYDWLLGFISHSGLSYNCLACKQMPRDSTLPAEGDSQPGIPSTQQCVLQDMHTMKLAICELKTQIISIANNLQAFTGGDSVKEMTVKEGDVKQVEDKGQARSYSSAAKPMTYAEILNGSNLYETVKAAVKRSFKSLKQADRDSTCIAVYNLPERDDDLNGVLAITASIGCPVDVVKLFRIGKKSVTTRPLRVFLRSTADRDRILQRARNLKNSAKYSAIRVNKWLSRDETERIKAVRQRCQVLNDASSKRPDGKKQFVVLSGKLMSQSEDGSLRQYRKPARSISKTAQTTPQPRSGDKFHPDVSTPAKSSVSDAIPPASTANSLQLPTIQSSQQQNRTSSESKNE